MCYIHVIDINLLSIEVATLQALYLLFFGILSRHSTQKKHNTYGVDFPTAYITQGRLTPTLGYQKRNAYSVEQQIHYRMRRMTIQSVLFHAMICIISCGKIRHIANCSLYFFEIAILCLFFVAWGVTSLFAFFICILCYI